MVEIDLRKYGTDKVYQELVNDCLKGISKTQKDSELAKKICEILQNEESAEGALCQIAYETERYLKEPCGVRCLKGIRKNGK